MQKRKLTRIILLANALLLAALVAGCLFLSRGLVKTGFIDITGALLMLAALVVFAKQGLASTGRLRWFWMLQAAGWALWLADQA